MRGERFHVCVCVCVGVGVWVGGGDCCKHTFEQFINPPLHGSRQLWACLGENKNTTNPVSLAKAYIRPTLL